MNLADTLQFQINRAKGLREQYDETESGWFASGVITDAIKEAEHSRIDQDLHRMVDACHRLERLE